MRDAFEDSFEWLRRYRRQMIPGRPAWSMPFVRLSFGIIGFLRRVRTLETSDEDYGYEERRRSLSGG